MKTKTADGIRVYCSHDKIVNIDELKPNPKNPNQHPDEQIELLSKIILQNGWRDRITVSNLSGLIVKGHGRYMAAIGAGLSEVPVDYQDYEDAAAEYADLIADNKIAELSEVDDDAASELLLSLDDVDFDVELAGYTREEYDDIIENSRFQFQKSNTKSVEKPEIEFSEEILLEHNYVVLYFDDILDWQVAVEKFGLKKVKDLIPRKGQPVGVGRVLKGAQWLDRIK